MSAIKEHGLDLLAVLPHSDQIYEMDSEGLPTSDIPEDAPVCRIAAKACHNVGLTPFFDRGGGGMDGNVFNKRGITTIGIAPGYEKNHTAEELLHVDDLFKCGEEATEIIKIVASGEY